MDVQALAQSLGLDTDTTRQLLQTFLNATTSDLAALREALATSDATRVAELAHHIKGAAANLELETMRSAALELEMAAKDGRTEGGDGIAATISSELESLKGAI